MQLVGEELKNYKVLLALFCFVLYESIWEVWTRSIVAGEIPGPWLLVTVRKLNSFQR